MKNIIRLSETELRNIIDESIKSVLNKGENFIINESKSYKFRIDEISKITLRNDKGTYILSESNNWILKRKNWEINNYKRFLDIVNKTPKRYKGYLTYHGMEEITGNDWITYTLKGHDVAFALHYLSPGQIDFCNFVNNSDLSGIGNEVLQFAKNEGATQMDNYRGFPTENDQKVMENQVIFIVKMALINKLGMINLIPNFNLLTLNGNQINLILKMAMDLMLKDLNYQDIVPNTITHNVHIDLSLTNELVVNLNKS